ncbi:MAG: cytochrome C [Deltaproteobacteria bacterium]|nr:cytochrome C [Deltaproteobacteria bacterium]MBW2019793.1 cytochrome C [Deltaproteobacteria bacterium]MBW2074598.1 cytochrome C [Deltaproteobacteria bacterium]
MSTTEEKEQAVAEDEQKEAGDEQAAEEVPAEATPEPVKPGTWRFLIPIAAFFVGFVVLLFVGWIIFPQLLYCEKQQPIDFSHKLHVEEVGECEGCHFFREDGSFSGVPKLENCLQCHEEPMGEHPEEAKLIKEYVEPEKEIPWYIYARQPVCVFFSHAAHVKMGELECETCHGPVGDSDHVRPYQYNRLTKYSRDIWGWNIAGFKKNSWDRMKMDDCAECHEKMKGTKDACFVCHK